MLFWWFFITTVRFLLTTRVEEYGHGPFTPKQFLFLKQSRCEDSFHPRHSLSHNRGLPTLDSEEQTPAPAQRNFECCVHWFWVWPLQEHSSVLCTLGVVWDLGTWDLRKDSQISHKNFLEILKGNLKTRVSKSHAPPVPVQNCGIYGAHRVDVQRLYFNLQHFFVQHNVQWSHLQKSLHHCAPACTRGWSVLQPIFQVGRPFDTKKRIHEACRSCSTGHWCETCCCRKCNKPKIPCFDSDGKRTFSSVSVICSAAVSCVAMATHRTGPETNASGSLGNDSPPLENVGQGGVHKFQSLCFELRGSKTKRNEVVWERKPMALLVPHLQLDTKANVSRPVRSVHFFCMGSLISNCRLSQSWTLHLVVLFVYQTKKSTHSKQGKWYLQWRVWTLWFFACMVYKNEINWWLEMNVDGQTRSLTQMLLFRSARRCRLQGWDRKWKVQQRTKILFHYVNQVLCCESF